MKHSPKLGGGVIIWGFVMVGLRVAEEFATNWAIWFLGDKWLVIGIAFIVAGVLLFPFTSLRDPKQKLIFGIKWIGFEGIYQIEPTIVLFLKIMNHSDINQKLDNIKGQLFYSASYEDDTFPEHPLQQSFNETQQIVKAKDSEILQIPVPILPKSAERFKKYIEVGQYIFWSGNVNANVSAKIWGFERGGVIKSKPLAKFPHVPTSRHFEGIEEIL